MNVDQESTLAQLGYTIVTVRRGYGEVYCWICAEKRGLRIGASQARNALARKSILSGILGKHARKKHPDEWKQAKAGELWSNKVEGKA